MQSEMTLCQSSDELDEVAQIVLAEIEQKQFKDISFGQRAVSNIK